MKTETVQVNWRASKSNFATLVKNVYGLALRDKSLGDKRAQLSSSIEGLIYDLGHNGRGFDDFPFAIGLQVSNVRKVKSNFDDDTELEAELSGRDLISELGRSVGKYLRSHPYYQGNPKSYEAQISTLDILAEKAGDQKIRVKFGVDYEGLRDVDSLEFEKKWPF